VSFPNLMLPVPPFLSKAVIVGKSLHLLFSPLSALINILPPSAFSCSWSFFFPGVLTPFLGPTVPLLNFPLKVFSDTRRLLTAILLPASSQSCIGSPISQQLIFPILVPLSFPPPTYPPTLELMLSPAHRFMHVGCNRPLFFPLTLFDLPSSAGPGAMESPPPYRCSTSLATPARF